MSTGAVPRYFGLSYSTFSRYRVMRLDTGSFYENSLTFDSTEVVIKGTPTATKFHLELPTAGNGRFRHIRSCLNNKYLLRNGNNRIVAEAEEPEEDQSKSSCTLFEVVAGSTTAWGRTVQVRHVNSGMFLAIDTYHGWQSWTFVTLTNNAAGDPTSRFVVIDWESIVIFPEYVVFKGVNERYLNGAPGLNWSGPILQFIGDEGVADERSIHACRHGEDGSSRFLCSMYMAYWTRVTNDDEKAHPMNTIRPLDKYNDSRNRNSYFQVTRHDARTVSLRNVGNDRFIRNRGPTVWGQMEAGERPIADRLTVTPDTYLEVKEAVFGRSIYNVRFRVINARIYNQQTGPLSRFYEATNMGYEPLTRNLEIAFKKEEQSTYNHSVNIGVGLKTAFVVGKPMIAEGKIEVSTNTDYGHEWGVTETESKELTVGHFVVVPPRSIIEVRMIATKGTCDVPFSYNQRDTLADGSHVISLHHDGVYTGVTQYNFTYETRRRNV